MELAHTSRVEIRRGQSILIYPHTHFAGQSIARRSVAGVQHFHVLDSANSLGTSHPIGRLVGRQGGYEVCTPPRPKEFESDVRRAVHMANRPDARNPPHAREAMVTLILSQLQPQVAGSDRSVTDSPIDFARLTKWITAHLHRQISLDEMADVAGCSTSQFRAVFTRHFGQPPGTFVRKARHLEAARLLRETHQPIKQIAHKLGYDDLAHFYRFFQRISRQTPKSYRDQYQLKG
jgi:AraC-like DNA-binding protein